MDFEPADDAPAHWSEPKYPTDEEIAQLPQYMHPATRWFLTVLCFIAGCIAAGTAVMSLTETTLIGIFGKQIGEPPVDAPAVAATSKAAAWVGLLCGLSWMAAAVTISRNRMTATVVWFLLGVVTGIMMTFL